MTSKRKSQLIHNMVGYLIKHINDEALLFDVLYGSFGMSGEEIHEVGIHFLDGYLEPDNSIDRLTEKIEKCYKAYMQKWALCFPDQIIDKIDEIHAVSVAYRILTRRGVSEDNADWLVRFSDPLAVVSDAWMLANDIDDFICEARLEKVIDGLRDRGDAEVEYALDEDEA